MSISNESTQLENKYAFWSKLIITFFIIVGLRILLDNFSYPPHGEYFLPSERFIQAPLYFFSIFLSFSICTYYLTRSSFENIFHFTVKTFLLILIIPVFDLFFTGVSIDALNYVLINAGDFFKTFFKLLNPFSGQGITVGQHIGAALIFLALSFFVYKKTKNLLKSFLSIFFNYLVLFIYATIPSILVILENGFTQQKKSVSDSYTDILSQSWLSSGLTQKGFLSNIFANTSQIHEIAMARLFWLAIIIQLLLIFFISNRSLWNTLRYNLRPERLLYWFIIAGTGILTSEKLFGNLNLSNPVNIISLLTFLFLIVLNIWLAVFINDKEDVEIDEISNPSRPLIKKTVTKKEWSLLQIILVLLIISGLLTLTRSVAFLLILFQAIYYIYSVGPLKLKRNFITSSVSIGVASIFVSMAGFFLVSPDQHIFAYPLKAFFIIGIVYALLSNIKDIKDFEGDRQAKIMTMPVVFGLTNSKYIIAFIWSAVLISVPISLKIYTMTYPSILISIIIFYFFTKKEYQEKYIFLAFFVYSLIFFFTTR